jgi:CheY-like chemotaxis protein
VLIIEDEPIIAMDIETIVRDLGHSVTGVAVTRDEAVSQALARRPGSCWPTSSLPTTVRESMR